MKDLKGKVVGVPAFGGAIDVAARAMLIQNGLKPETDVQMLELPFAATEAALRAGKVTAAGFTSSFWNKATAKGGVRPLFHMRDAMGTSEMIFLAGKAEFLEKNKAALTDFVEDYIGGLRWFYDPKNREEALGYIAKFTKRPVSDFSAWALQGDKDYARARDGMINEKALQRNVDELHKLGLIKSKLDVSKHVDNSISQAAAARLSKPSIRSGPGLDGSGSAHLLGYLRLRVPAQQPAAQVQEPARRGIAEDADCQDPNEDFLQSAKRAARIM